MKITIEVDVKDCRNCPHKHSLRGHGECWEECTHPNRNRAPYENILWGCQEEFSRVPEWCPLHLSILEEGKTMTTHEKKRTYVLTSLSQPLGSITLDHLPGRVERVCVAKTIRQYLENKKFAVLTDGRDYHVDLSSGVIVFQSPTTVATAAYMSRELEIVDEFVVVTEYQESLHQRP